MNDSYNNTLSRQFIYTCPEKVFNDSTLSINELKIYMIIRSFMDTTGDAYPSNNWIADKLQISRRKAIDNINRLVEKGYLERININGRRHLRIAIKPILEQTDDSLPVTQTSPPSDANVTPPSDANVTQLDQSNIITKINKKERGAPARTHANIADVLPDDFKPNETHEQFAKENAIDLEKEHSAFRDYYMAHGKRMANWNAAFSSWLRKCLSFNKSQRAYKEQKEHPATASIREFKELMQSPDFFGFMN